MRQLLRLIAVIALLPSFAAAAHFMPRDHRALTRSATYAEMESFLQSLDGKGLVRVSVAGRTTKGRSVYLVNLRRSDAPTWTILFYAQQHGDELSGKDALLIRDLAEKPETLPADVDLWILPMMNPDGAEAGTRVNGAGADLNRDHMTLDQPETRALHEVVRRVQPHVAVDCHEFGRDSAGYRKRGWEKWPDITMDGLNNPLFDPAMIAAGSRWVEGAAAAEAGGGHATRRASGASPIPSPPSFAVTLFASRSPTSPTPAACRNPSSSPAVPRSATATFSFSVTWTLPLGDEIAQSSRRRPSAVARSSLCAPSATASVRSTEPKSTVDSRGLAM